MKLCRDTADTWRASIVAHEGDVWTIAADWLQDEGFEAWANELRGITDRTKAVRWWDTRVGRYSLARNPDMHMALRWFWKMTPQWMVSAVTNSGEQDERRWRWSWWTGRIDMVDVGSRWLSFYAHGRPDVAEGLPYVIEHQVPATDMSGNIWFAVRFRVSIVGERAFVWRPTLDSIDCVERVPDLARTFYSLPWHWSDFPRELFGPHFSEPKGVTP